MGKESNSKFDSPHEHAEQEVETSSFSEVVSRWLPIATLAIAFLVIFLWVWLWWTMQERRIKEERVWSAVYESTEQVVDEPNLSQVVADEVEPAKETPTVAPKEGEQPFHAGDQQSYEIVRGSFDDFGGRLKHEVIFQEHEDHLHYRLFVYPYHEDVALHFAQGQGSLFVLFVDGKGARVAPSAGKLSIPLGDLVPFEVEGVPTGWVVSEVLPLEDGEMAVGGVRVTKYFDPELHKLLLDLAN